MPQHTLTQIDIETRLKKELKTTRRDLTFLTNHAPFNHHIGGSPENVKVRVGQVISRCQRQVRESRAQRQVKTDL